MNLTTPSSQWPIIGHAWAVDQLHRAILNQRVHHAYLLTGPASVGKTTLARSLAMALNCRNADPPCGQCRFCTLIKRGVHPDVTITEAEQVGGTLKIDQIRELQRNLSLRPYEAQYKVAILRRFHEANPATQNALLKTLEEPPQSVVLILTSDHSDLLLPTIVSRCQVMNLRPLSLETTTQALQSLYPEQDQTQVALAARLSGGRLGWGIRTLEDADGLEFRNKAIAALEAILSAKTRSARFQIAEALAQEKGDLMEILEHWLSYWRDIMLMTAGSQSPIINVDCAGTLEQLAQTLDVETAQRALQATQKTASYLNRNANARLCMEVLTLDYPVL